MERNSTLAPMLDQMQAQSGDDGPSPSSIDQVFGAMSAPETLDAAMQMQSGKMTLDFFVQMTMNDPASVTKLMAKAEEENAGTAEHDGSTFYMLPANGGPEGCDGSKSKRQDCRDGNQRVFVSPRSQAVH